MDEDDSDKETKKQLTEGEIIKRKKQSKKYRQDKLLQSLERSRKEAKEEEGARKKALSIFSRREEVGATGRNYTVSVALAGSILDNAQSPELRTYLAGQVARALAVFCVDEVIVFDDKHREKLGKSTEGDYSGIGKHGQGCLQLARVLQFLECPQYLRKNFFPIHQDLKYAGVLNPTDMPHHLRATEESRYREGVVLDRPPTKSGSLVNVGLRRDIVIDKKLAPGIRVTISLDSKQQLQGEGKLYGKVVSPSAPRTEAGIYWGYTVRLAETLTEVFAKGPFGEYDYTIGTSERGSSVDKVCIKGGFKHLLIVFGGVKGLEAALEADDNLEGEDPEPLFDAYVNTCPGQGSRTIRTEEAMLVSLAALRPKIEAAQVKRKE